MGGWSYFEKPLVNHPSKPSQKVSGALRTNRMCNLFILLLCIPLELSELINIFPRYKAIEGCGPTREAASLKQCAPAMGTTSGCLSSFVQDVSTYGDVRIQRATLVAFALLLIYLCVLYYACRNYLRAQNLYWALMREGIRPASDFMKTKIRMQVIGATVISLAVIVTRVTLPKYDLDFFNVTCGSNPPIKVFFTPVKWTEVAKNGAAAAISIIIPFFTITWSQEAFRSGLNWARIKEEFRDEVVAVCPFGLSVLEADKCEIFYKRLVEIEGWYQFYSDKAVWDKIKPHLDEVRGIGPGTFVHQERVKHRGGAPQLAVAAPAARGADTETRSEIETATASEMGSEPGTTDHESS
jgi:hypothetical protein